MINNKMLDAINKQINAELYSFYLYMAMSAHFASLNHTGFASWLKVQAMEEMTHAAKFYEFVISRNGNVELFAIDAPPKSWKSPLGAFEEVLKHEQKVTGLINDLVDLSLQVKDHASNAFLQWFVNEQVEEEASAEEIIQKIKMLGDDGKNLYLLDKDLGARQLIIPPWLNLNMGPGAAGTAP